MRISRLPPSFRISCWCWRPAISNGRRRSSRWCAAKDFRCRVAAGLRRDRWRGAARGCWYLDTRGELALLYREALVGFVGGTLVPIGGHNLLEPALWGIPVLFGPHTDHCAEVATLLSNAQGGRMVKDGQDLAHTLRELLRDPDGLRRMGQSAQQVVANNQGALRRTADVIATLLPGAGATESDPVDRSGEMSSRQS